jgi:hypothetical protein
MVPEEALRHAVSAEEFPQPSARRRQVVPRAPGCLDPFPLLKALHARLRALPAVAAFLASGLRKTKTQAGVPGYRAAVDRTLGR